MAQNIPAKGQHSLKPILILTVAVILLSKGQRALTDDSSELGSSDKAICPDYCNLPPDRATKGKAPFRMWYYDPSEGGCKRFRWGGRGGNKNRFHLKADCEETCSKCSPSELLDDGVLRDQNSATDAVCAPPMDAGQCDNGKSTNDPQLVWHYNKEKAKCSPFIFYGCGGNSNRFSTQKECEDICH